LLHARSLNGRVAWQSHLADNQLRDVITTAFYASLQPDEGRLPRFRLFSYALPEWEGTVLAHFHPPLTLDTSTIRRIAPVCPPHSTAMLVVSHGDKLEVSDLISIEPRFSHHEHPDITLGSSPEGLMIAADGPGDLRITEGGVTLRLRAGRLSLLSPFWKAAPLLAWAESAAARLIEELRAEGYDEEHIWLFSGVDGMRNVIVNMWGHILATVVGRRHGGAFLLLSEAPDSDLHVQYPICGLSLGRAIYDYWKACLEAKREPADWQVARILFSRQSLFSCARSIASLANADGCVVLDSDQAVLGFGAEIRIDQNAQAMSNTTVLGEEAALGGMRHRSMFRFCNAHRTAVGFVISQDGDLTSCASDERSLTWSTNLAPRLQDAFRYESTRRE